MARRRQRRWRGVGWSGTRRQGGTTQRAISAAASPEPVLDDYAAWQRGAGGESSGGRVISWRGFRAPLCSRVVSAGAALALSSPPSARLPNENLPPAVASPLFFFFFFAERLDTMRAAERREAAG